MKRLVLLSIFGLTGFIASAQEPDIQTGINELIFESNNTVLNPFYATEYRFVNTDGLNVRDYPVYGNVIGQLNRGDKVPVYAVSDSWVQISVDSQWVSAKYLCDTDGCYEKSHPNERVTVQQGALTYQSAQSKPQPAKSAPKKGVAPKRTYGNSSCPCSGSYNCTGPRGGKYCITSGGSKRYR